MNIGNIYVPSEGNKDAAIFLVGEAPGLDEEEARRPFVGASGQFLERYLGRCGLNRSELYFSNLSKYRPKGNRFEYLLDTTELQESIEELRAEIEEVDPHVIVALGNWPLWFLTGLKSDKKNAERGTGISIWRGSTVPCKLVEGHKVTITYHPAFVIRPNGYENHPIFESDLRRVVHESFSKALQYPQYRANIDPSSDRIDEFVDRYINAEWLSVDIETFGPKLACIGFADGVGEATCLTVLHEERNWDAARAILAGPAKKIFQYGVFDINYLKWYYGWETQNFAWDTYVAQNNLNPGFPKGLDFLASIYTQFPYYKSERKDWKSWEKRGNLDTLWRYNLKDVIATYMIAIQQMEEAQC